MKMVAILLMTTTLFLTGCRYEEPLTEEHTIPVDTSVLGLWELIPEKGKESKPDERMMILKYSGTEYLIHHPLGKYGFYYRGYPIKIGGIPCVQLQVIGTEDGIPGKDDRELFHVVSYRLASGDLEISILNTELIDDDLKKSGVLRKAFLKNKNNKDLFTNPGKFRKVGGKS